MLKPAIMYKSVLEQMECSTWFDEKYKFLNTSGYDGQLNLAETTWTNHQFVSVDSHDNVLGYIAYGIDRTSEDVHSLQIKNFTNNKIIFGNDLKQVLLDIFTKYNFRKLTFMVVIGNPVEKSYDSLIKKFNGRIVGIYRQHVRLMDNKFYDQKIYEIFREDVLAKLNKEGSSKL